MSKFMTAVAGCIVVSGILGSCIYMNTGENSCRTDRVIHTRRLPDAGGCRTVCPDGTEYTAEVRDCSRVEEDPDDAGMSRWVCVYILGDCNREDFDAGWR